MLPEQDVDLIVTFHQEQELCIPTLKSISFGRNYAKKNGIKTNLICICDSCDDRTISLVKKYTSEQGANIVQSDNGDPSISRNQGISISNSKYVGIFDGDDIYSRNFIVNSINTIKKEGNNTICHPEIIFSFGQYNNFCYQIDQDAPWFDPDGLLSNNYWGNCVLAHRSVFEQCPYEENLTEITGYGMEDWHWGCETVANGYIHKLSWLTCMFYRRKNKSVLIDHLSNNALMRPNSLFSI